MRIAVDAQSVEGQKTGIGVFAGNLMEAMAQEAPDIQWLRYTRASGKDLNPLERVFWESVSIPLKVLRDKPDWVYSPGFAPAFFSPVPQLVTVHDLIGKIYPGNQPAAARAYWSWWLPNALKKARKLVASSESTRSDLERFLGISPRKVKVVPLSAHASFRKLENSKEAREVLLKYNIRSPFLISVGTIEPRKNHLGLLEAYQKIREKAGALFKLVIVGKPGGAERDVEGFIEEKDLGEHVKILGYVPGEDLTALYNAALGYAFVSFYEGFGLPALEAMSCGKSGVASKRSSIPEVVGDTAILVDPENTGEIAEAMLTFVSDNSLRQTLSDRAYARSKDFSTRKTARSMIGIFKNEAFP